MYNTSVESRPRRASQREEMSRVSKCSHEFRKVNTDNKITRQHVEIKGDICVCDVFEDSLIRLHRGQHKQTERPLSPYFSQRALFSKEKVWRSDGAE